MSLIAEMEVLQAQLEELQKSVDKLRIGEAYRGQSKDFSLVAAIEEFTGETNGSPCMSV
jgi:prefoldin subunit 5